MIRSGPVSKDREQDGAGSSAHASRRLSRPFLCALAAFALYVVLPYPRFFQLPARGEHWPTACGLAFILACLGLWILCVGRDAFRPDDADARGTFSRRGALLLATFAVLFLFLEATFLARPASWMGDEQFHIERGLQFAHELGRGALWNDNPILRFGLKRYPPLAMVLHVLAANPIFGTLYETWAWRLMPFACCVLFAMLPYGFLRREAGDGVAIGAVVAIAAVPLVFVYAAIVAIEPLMILIEGAVLFRLMDRPFTRRAMIDASLIASTLGAVKETALPFLLAMAIWIAGRVATCEATKREKAVDVVRLWGVLLLPSLPYEVIRGLASPRPPVVQGGLANLASPLFAEYWLAAARTQITPVFFGAAVVGLALMIRRGRGADAAIVAVLSLGANAALYSVDLLMYVGFSRFTLCLMPSLAVGLAGLLAIVDSRRTAPMLLFAIIVNGAAAIPWTDEAHEDWIMPGERDFDAGAWRFYPYDEAIDYIAGMPNNACFMVAAGTWLYTPVSLLEIPRAHLEERFAGHIEPRSTLAEAIQQCRAHGARLLLFQSDDLSNLAPPADLKHIAAFTRGRRTLDLYELRADTAAPR